MISWLTLNGISVILAVDNWTKYYRNYCGTKHSFRNVKCTSQNDFRVFHTYRLTLLPAFYEVGYFYLFCQQEDYRIFKFILEIVNLNSILHQKIHATCLIVKKLDSTAWNLHNQNWPADWEPKHNNTKSSFWYNRKEGREEGSWGHELVAMLVAGIKSHIL